MPITKNIALHLGALAFALLPHIARLPLWVVFWCVIAWGYILVVVKYRLPLPGKALRLVMTIGGTAAVLLTTGFSLDRYSSVALLWIMACIKPMEIRTYRDEMVTIFLIYFLAVSSLFFSSSFAVGLYMAFSICVTTAVLIHIHQPRSLFSGNLGLSATLMLKALPLALILFVVFPRIHGSLWGLRSPATAQSGFSDRLTPGSVTRLVRNSDIAFRVAFDGRIPERDRLYWRGLVFWFFDGQSWQPSKNGRHFARPLKGQNSVAYTITLEPHNQRWLFALDLPYKFGSQGLIFTGLYLNLTLVRKTADSIQGPILPHTTTRAGYGNGSLRPCKPHGAQTRRRPLWPANGGLTQIPWLDVVNTALRYFQAMNLATH